MGCNSQENTIHDPVPPSLCINGIKPIDHVESELGGFIVKDHPIDPNRPVQMWLPKGLHKQFWKYSSQQDEAGIPEKDKNLMLKAIKPHRARIFDARELQATFESPQAMFEKHGFCLLNHKSAVKDWNGDYANTNNDITNIYQDEVIGLIKNEVFKGYNVNSDIKEGMAPAVLRRGEGGTKMLVFGVHNDYGLTIEARRKQTLGCTGDQNVDNQWHAAYEQEDCIGAVGVCFWRPINMSEPLDSNPLCLCSSASLNREDIVPIEQHNIWQYGVTSQLSLKYDADQQWFYFPKMTKDETICFKQFYYMKAEGDGQKYRGAFHSAFKDPRSAKDAQPRNSCEYRVPFFLKK